MLFRSMSTSESINSPRAYADTSTPGVRSSSRTCSAPGPARHAFNSIDSSGASSASTHPSMRSVSLRCRDHAEKMTVDIGSISFLGQLFKIRIFRRWAAKVICAPTRQRRSTGAPATDVARAARVACLASRADPLDRASGEVARAHWTVVNVLPPLTVLGKFLG